MTETPQWFPPPLPDLAGRIIVVTGANSGLGAVTTRELARANAHVVLAVRNTDKGRAVADTLSGSAEVRSLDLSNLASVRAFADNWTGPLDILINNAGIMAMTRGTTTDGFEPNIGTNHLGPFALTNLLLPYITDRIVTVSSGLARIGHIDLDDLSWQHRAYKPWRAYGQSKLANLLFTYELQRRLTAVGSQVRALAAHPGVAATPLDRHIGGLQGRLTRLGYRFAAQKEVDYGALPTLFAATQDIPGNSYVGPGGRSGERPKIDKRRRADSDPDIARRLWDLSAQLTGITA